MDIIFLVPAISAARDAASDWSRLDTLFDLVAAVFLSGWVLGWSIAPLLMTTILVLDAVPGPAVPHQCVPRTVEISLSACPVWALGRNMRYRGCEICVSYKPATKPQRHRAEPGVDHILSLTMAPTR